MARNKPKLSKPDNFRPLDPASPTTRSLIEAMLAARDPLPYPAPPAPREWRPLATLAERIRHRANASRVTHLSPETARTVATALMLVADGPLTVAGIKHEYGFRVLDMTVSPPTVLVYATNALVAKAAWREACQQYPRRDLVAIGTGSVLGRLPSAD